MAETRLPARPPLRRAAPTSPAASRRCRRCPGAIWGPAAGGLLSSPSAGCFASSRPLPAAAAPRTAASLAPGRAGPRWTAAACACCQFCTPRNLALLTSRCQYHCLRALRGTRLSRSKGSGHSQGRLQGLSCCRRAALISKRHSGRARAWVSVQRREARPDVARAHSLQPAGRASRRGWGSSAPAAAPPPVVGGPLAGWRRRRRPACTMEAGCQHTTLTSAGSGQRGTRVDKRRQHEQA